MRGSCEGIPRRRVGRAQRAHHLAARSMIDGGHVASLLCPPYGIRRRCKYCLSSLRAQRSNPFFLYAAQMDCFATLAMTWIDMASHPRGALRPSFGFVSAPAKFRGRREGRVLAGTRGLVCNEQTKAHTSIQVSAGASGLPCAMVLRLIARSPWRRIPLASIAGELTIPNPAAPGAGQMKRRHHSPR